MSGLGRRTHYRKHLTDSVMYDLPEPKENERIAKIVASRGGNQFDVVVAAKSSSSSSAAAAIPSVNNSDGGANDGEVDTSVTTVEPLPSSAITTAIPQLALLPTKFNKLVWLKRNDFVIVETGDEEAKEHENKGDDEGGVRYMISHILYKDQIKHLLRKGLWPTEDPNFQTEHRAVDDEQTTREGNNNKNVNPTLETHDYDQYDSEQEYEEGADIESEEEHLATSSSSYLAANRADDGIVYDDGYGDDFFVNTNRIATMKIQDSSESEEE